MLQSAYNGSRSSGSGLICHLGFGSDPVYIVSLGYVILLKAVPCLLLPVLGWESCLYEEVNSSTIEEVNEWTHSQSKNVGDIKVNTISQKSWCHLWRYGLCGTGGLLFFATMLVYQLHYRSVNFTFKCLKMSLEKLENTENHK